MRKTLLLVVQAVLVGGLLDGSAGASEAAKNQVPVQRAPVTGVKNGGVGAVGMLADAACCELPVGQRVVLLVDSPGGAIGLTAGAMGTVVCCDSSDPNLPILVSWDGWLRGGASTSYCDVPPATFPPESGWWMACEEIQSLSIICCDMQPGDSVTLLVDNPSGATGLAAGATGIVVCCDSDDPVWPVLVSWDGWTEGEMAVSYCDVPPGPSPTNSGWWMMCNEIGRFECGHPNPVGDLNGDCKTDMRDIAVLCEHWLDCAAIGCS